MNNSRPRRNRANSTGGRAGKRGGGGGGSGGKRGGGGPSSGISSSFIGMLLVALSVPIGIAVFLVLRSRKAAAGAEKVSTDGDDTPDSPRPDPYASAFCEDEGEESPRPDPFASSFDGVKPPN